ncbi:NADH-quinone oxidoreductase subunit G [Nocardioides sp. BP30]|uniref:NADH-quinone oxidoreductase subunit G n=1 Tax=Nocardioides sp. BP30 TaxID=3036374 RepID=UPI002468BC1F|nr:NADH-quinone oxidoreductase subunit G [Nocardioides sp. BP30]WGL52950.1 NADH-quinone oxidoreductase subunit G [Nocardioides sp. BP30]
MTETKSVEHAEKTVTLTIDGIAVTVPEGTLVIRAAEQVGVQIPRFCDHPLLAPVGACRQCLVDIPDAGNGRGFPKPQASCTIPVAEGMVVETNNATASKAQQGIMEFLLVNHPLDCPVCDKGGECPLQNQAMSSGRSESRFASTGGVKRTFPKPINLSPNILLDRERCIVCQRCTRFAAEIPGDPGIALIERGARQQIGIAEGRDFSSYFSGNVIQICPVGALTSAEYRFRSRPFDLVSSTGVAEHDACGAALRIDHRRGTVMRRLAGNDPEVNQEWISDKDRFAFRYADAADRLRYPMVRDSDDPERSVRRAVELRPASWLEAFELAARGLAAAGGGDAVGVLVGGRVTLEDAAAYSSFARSTLGGADIDFRARPLSAEETRFLAEHVRGRAEVTYADLDAAPEVVLLGLEPEDEAGTIFLRLRASRHGKRIRTVAPLLSAGSIKLGAELVGCTPGAEAAAIAALDDVAAGAVVLVGERLAISPGALDAAAALAERSGARMAWVPRRAGDRGAVEAGAFPLDAASRDADQIIAGVLSGDVRALVVGGVDPDDTSDPAAFRAALEQAELVVSLELRPSEVTRRADVVLPVAAVTEKAGTFLTWEGRRRPFPKVLDKPATYSDAQILEQIATRYPATTGVLARPTEPLLEMRPGDEAGRYRTAAPGPTFHLSTWRLMIDNASLQTGDKSYAATARPAVALLSRANVARLGATVTITGDRGSVTVPVAEADLADDVVWLPTNSIGRGVWADLASPGSSVEVTSA